MKREILFRAKLPIAGEWIYGTPIYRPGDQFLERGIAGIIRVTDDRQLSYSDVLLETIGQFIGLKDALGIRIYDGDVVNDILDNRTRVVKWSDINASFYLSSTTKGKSYYKEFTQCGQHQSDDVVCIDSIKVIGNIYDNPELLTL